MSNIIVATFINLAVTVLPLIGVDVGSEQLTNTIQTVVAILTGIWIWIRRVQMGDVNVAGIRKS